MKLNNYYYYFIFLPTKTEKKVRNAENAKDISYAQFGFRQRLGTRELQRRCLVKCRLKKHSIEFTL